MRKRLLCVLLAAVLLLGVLTGCGGGPSSSSDPDKPGVGSAEPDKPDKGGKTENDPLAVMQERVKAVNDAINYECVGLEETVEAGLLFYNLYNLALMPPPQNPDYGKSHDYNPNKPLNYRVRYEVHKGRTEGIVSEDTYAALLRDLCQNKILLPSVFSAEDVVETDDLYVYYSPQTYGTRNYRPWCYFLVKDTNIVYWFTVEEAWSKADYYGNGYYGDGTPPQGHVDLHYTEDDAEYIFTAEFWKAYAQTVKFVGDVDDDSKMRDYVKFVYSADSRGTVNIPYVEEWYAGGSYDKSAIRGGFEEFLKNLNSNREVEVVFRLDDGTEKTYPATRQDDEFTIDLGNGQVWIYIRYEAVGIALSKEPENITGEYLPETGYFKYADGATSFLVIDDFGQGEPVMFLNNGLYKYTGGGEATLIHDFSVDIDENQWIDIYTDTDRTWLLFTGGGFSYKSVVVDLKTFKVMDEVNIFYDLDSEGIREFSYATINGVSVDEGTAWGERDDWLVICDVWLGGKETHSNLGLDAAWNEYENRG